jgi:hypothetical protein
VSVLNITMEKQRADQWCWAAVTSCVCQTLNNQTISQEDIVCQMLANQTCSTKPVPSDCDVPIPLENPLKAICNCTVDFKVTLTYEQIQDQIDTAGRPIPIGLQFTAPGQTVLHYCLIKGCNTTNGSNEVVILDPAHDGESNVPYNNLVDGSALAAQWIESFILL